MFLDATILAEHFAEHPPQPGEIRAVLGPRIRRARVNRLRGLSLEVFGREIANALGRKRPFSNVTISNWETGRQEPSFEALVAIADLTHLPLRYFAGVGDLDDYPFVNWLADEQPGEIERLVRALLRARSLPERQQRIVIAQVKSLVSDLHRLTHGDNLRH